MRYALLAGRLLFSVIFVIAAAGHFSAETIDYAARQGVPMADLLVPISGTVALMGGLSVMVGFQTRLGAASLVVFLIPVTFEMHKFWIAGHDGVSDREGDVHEKPVDAGWGAHCQLLWRRSVELGCLC